MLARILLTLTLLLPSLAMAQSGAPNPRIADGIGDLAYGIYCAQEPERRDPAPNTASGHLNIVPTIPDLQFRQKLVPAELGIGFGVLATAAPGVIHDPVTVTVTHPPYPDSGIEVEQWTSDIDDLGPSLMGFSFDTPNELLLGEWTFSAHTSDGTELFHIAFEVVPPELMPQVISGCFGSFLS
ncbi:DUF3859 domain-containing protein [Gymnodinialimonas ulvae]|uniref:DUF3859 domain-containing protein n=1 Tax=Gymnodinialimonas ulvae TaxID=3126504 RepID=UPI0030984CD5